MAFCQAGQPVRFVHLKHVALQHGVVGIALHFNAVVGKHMPVVFDVLAEFGLGGVFKPGLEARQYLVTRQLRRCVGVVVGQRNVSRCARRDTEAQSHDLGAHGIKRRGFGVHRNKLCRFDLAKPLVKRLPAKDRVVMQVADAFGKRQARRSARQSGFVKQAGRVRPASRGVGLGRLAAQQFGRRRFDVNLPDQALEAIFLIKRSQCASLLGSHSY